MTDSTRPPLPTIPPEAQTPLVDTLLEIIEWQNRRIAALEDEIHQLKKETRKPPPPPSQMEKSTEPPSEVAVAKKKGPQRQKTALLEIHEEQIIQPPAIPAGSRFKGYRDVVVQDLLIKPHVTRYRLANYQTPDGSYVVGKLPDTIRGGHWGATLHGFLLYQYHHQHVTQPLLLEQIRDFGIDISSGQLSQLLTQDLDVFHAEKDSLLRVGLSVSPYIHTDDTGARHNGETGYCTHIGNELFAWFESTESKSRINFLELLGKAVDKSYCLNGGAFDYMAKQKLPKALLAQLEASPYRRWGKAADFEAWLDSQAIKGARHRRIVTEGALMGSLLQQGIPTNMAVISDDAGQFNVFDHALCWIHAERLVNRLIPVNDQQKEAVNGARDAIWRVYADLKAYKQHPDPAQADAIRACFDTLCNTKTDYATLNQILKRLRQNRHELLRVLDRPELPLHNNLSERDIRDYVKKRKISGSTRSDDGRQCRDTFASLKKTCRKHGISFWKYLLDRLSATGNVQTMADIIRTAACG